MPKNNKKSVVFKMFCGKRTKPEQNNSKFIDAILEHTDSIIIEAQSNIQIKCS